MGETSKFLHTFYQENRLYQQECISVLRCGKPNHSMVYQMFTEQITDYKF